MVLEVFWLIAAASACVLVAVALTDARGILAASPVKSLQISAVLAAAAGIPAAVLFGLRRWGGRLFPGFPEGDRVPGFAGGLVNFAAHIVVFVLQGSIVLLLARGVFGVPFDDYWLAAGTFALAFVAGFIAPGVPAGLGVREAVLVAGLSLETTAAAAIALATLHRVITVAGDGVFFGLALAGRRIIANRKAESR